MRSWNKLSCVASFIAVNTQQDVNMAHSYLAKRLGTSAHLSGESSARALCSLSKHIMPLQATCFLIFTSSEELAPKHIFNSHGMELKAFLHSLAFCVWILLIRTFHTPFLIAWMLEIFRRKSQFFFYATERKHREWRVITSCFSKKLVWKSPEPCFR